MSAASGTSTAQAAGYSSISVPPGTMPHEDQPCLTAIDSNSCVLLVGATRGIGLEFAKQIITKGARLVATHRDDKGADVIVRSVMKEVDLLQLDVAKPETIAAAANSYTGPKFTHII